MLPNPIGTIHRADDPNVIWVRFDKKEWEEYYNTLHSPDTSPFPMPDMDVIKDPGWGGVALAMVAAFLILAAVVLFL